MSAMFFNINALYCGVSKGKFEKHTSLSINVQGIKEDYHDDSDIIMLDVETYKKMLEHSGEALCMTKFYAHIIVDNLDNITIGDVITNGTLKLRINKIGKDCHTQEGCQYSHECPLKHKTVYLKCLRLGQININERWEVI